MMCPDPVGRIAWSLVVPAPSLPRALPAGVATASPEPRQRLHRGPGLGRKAAYLGARPCRIGTRTGVQVCTHLHTAGCPRMRRRARSRIPSGGLWGRLLRAARSRRRYPLPPPLNDISGSPPSVLRLAPARPGTRKNAQPCPVCRQGSTGPDHQPEHHRTALLRAVAVCVAARANREPANAAGFRPC